MEEPEGGAGDFFEEGRDGRADGGGVTGHEPFAVVPVIEEELRVGRRVIETGRVRVSKTVQEREEVVDEPLMREEFDVERVPVEVYVDAPVGPWHDGETLVIPVVEEVLFVEKRLVVREEIRITRRSREEHRPQRVTLLGEEVSVERLGPERGEADEGGGGLRNAAPRD